MKKKSLLAIILVAANTVMAQSNFTKTSDGVRIQLQQNPSGAKLLQLSVVNNKTIQVKATAANEFSSEKSLIAVTPINATSKWNVIQPRQFVSEND